MRTIILLGPPGAGKGTVAEGIVRKAGYTHVSTGDMLRAAVKADTQVGREARQYMEAGELVPDDVIIRIVEERLDSGRDDENYMFDGFPRTEEQAESLDSVLLKLGSAVEHVFLLEVPRELLIDRLTGRRVCRSCGAIYHVRNLPPKQDGVCDRCGSNDLYQRPDDTVETVTNRLDVYEKQTSSLIDFYERKGVLVRIDSSQGKEMTEDALLTYLES